MKIKVKKPFGEKHRLRGQKHAERRRADDEKQHEDDGKKHRAFLEGQAWYQRILALKPSDPCEFYQQPDWHSAVFVQRVPGTTAAWHLERWQVRNLQGKGLRVRHVRRPGDHEAFPGLNVPKSERRLSMERKLEAMYAKIGKQRPVVEDVVSDPEADMQVAS